MKPADCVKLEKDRALKLDYMRNTPYWKNFLFVAPSCILFIGLVGAIYLLKLGMLVSWYVIPFLVLFVFGTIWLKGVKKHILKTKVDDPANFHVCIGISVGEQGGYTYIIYANNEKRHNEHYISTLAEDYPLSFFSKDQLQQAKKQPIFVYEEALDKEIHLKAFKTSDISKRHARWNSEDGLPLFAIDERQVVIIKKKDL